MMIVALIFNTANLFAFESYDESNFAKNVYERLMVDEVILTSEVSSDLFWHAYKTSEVTCLHIIDKDLQWNIIHDSYYCNMADNKYSQEIYQKLEANEIEFVSQVAPQRFIKFLKKSTVTCVHNVDKNFEGTIVNDNYHCAF